MAKLTQVGIWGVAAAFFLGWSPWGSTHKVDAAPHTPDAIELSVEGESSIGPLSKLREGHPRTLFTADRIAQIRFQSSSDSLLRGYVERTLVDADTQVAHVQAHEIDNGQDAFTAFMQLGFAWYWTHKPQYAAAGVSLFTELTEHGDWSGDSGLSMGTLLGAYGLGYDMFYGQLPQDTHAAALDVFRGEFGKYVRAYGGWAGQEKPLWWVSTPYNWNAVMNGSVVVACLAVADELPKYAQFLLPRAVQHLRRSVAEYDPDGAWPEGISYWMYSTMHLTEALAAMDNALGGDMGLTNNAPGLSRTGEWIIMANSPSDRDATFADDPNPHSWGGDRYPLLWFAKRYNEPYLAARILWYAEHINMEHPTFLALWYPERPPTPEWYPPNVPLSKYFGGPAAMMLTRTDRENRDALWAYVKGGSNGVNHGHLDLGSFQLEALGVRWADDLGAGNYKLPGYFGTQRYEYFRTSTASHNTLEIDGRNQPLDANAPFVFHEVTPDGIRAVLDLSEAYPQAQHAMRGVATVDHQRDLLVQDEITLSKPHDIRWAMMTHAQILLKGSTAVLQLAGKTLEVHILSPANARFSLLSAYREPPENTNQGFQLLAVELKGVTGKMRLAVLLAPQWSTSTGGYPAVVPLSQWMSTADGLTPATMDPSGRTFDRATALDCTVCVNVGWKCPTLGGGHGPRDDFILEDGLLCASCRSSSK